MQATIEIAEAAIEVAIKVATAGIGIDPIGSADKTGDGVPILFQPDTDRRGPGGPKAGTGVTLQPLQGQLHNVGDDLHPDQAGGTAVRDDDAPDGMADLFQHAEMMQNGEAIGLEQGAPKMTDVMR